MVPFHAMAELKQNSTGKDLNVTNINAKASPSNCQIGLPLNSSFCNCQNDHRLGNTNIFGYVSLPPLLHFKILQLLVCKIILSF